MGRYSLFLILFLLINCSNNRQNIISNASKNGIKLQKEIYRVELPLYLPCDSTPVELDPENYGTKFFINDVLVEFKESHVYFGKLDFEQKMKGNYYLFYKVGDVMIPVIREISNNKLNKEIILTSNVYCGSDEFFSGREIAIINKSGEILVVSELLEFDRDINGEIIDSTKVFKSDTAFVLLK
jgi:hypothetical protein